MTPDVRRPDGTARVVVTGLGALTSLGTNVRDTWCAVLEGRSGVRQIRQFPSDSFPVHIGSEVDLEELDIDGFPDHVKRFVTRSVRLGAWALAEAWRDADLDDADFDPWTAGLVVGASNFPVIEDDEYAWPTDVLRDGRYQDQYLAICRELPHLLDQRQIGMVSTVLAAGYPLRGPCMTVQAACASATQAIGEAYQAVRDGSASIMVAGGADSMLSAVCVTGFTLLSAASTFQGDPTKACRPFDRKRDGLVLGEGAGLVVLEELGHALRRGALIHAEVIGYGSSCDGYRFTDSHPLALGPIRCMTAALADAGISPADVDYINAHGTSTPQNDRTETFGIKQVFGERAHDIPISSTKSQLGHLLCAAGGVEFIVTVLAVEHGMVPPTINFENPDIDCDLDYVTEGARPAALRTALSNSFGFGGQNGTVIVTRAPEPD
jgi:3-oxoacyl-[acyl-carrier-protein] synthase II